MMKNSIKLIMAAALIAARCCYAQPEVDDLSGALSKADVEAALAPLGSWFDQAETYCRNHDYSSCAVRLELKVGRGGGAPKCKVAYTTIKTDGSQGLYCKVAEATRYPARAQDSTFSLLFNIEPKQVTTATPAVEPAEPPAPPSLRGLLSSRAWAHRQVRGCEDQTGARSAASVDACFDANVGDFYWPFRHALARNPDMQGMIDVQVSIGRDGHATKVVAEAVRGALDAQFVDAVVSAVGDINFHGASDDTVIEHSLNFN